MSIPPGEPPPSDPQFDHKAILHPHHEMGGDAWNAGPPEQDEEEARSPEPVRTPDRGIWNHPATRIALYFVLVVGLLYSAIVVYTQAEPLLKRVGLTHAPLDLISAVLTALIAIFSLWIMTRFAEHRRLRDAGFTMRGVVTDTLIGYLIGLCVISVSIGIMTAIGVYHVTGINRPFAVLPPLLILLFVAIFEETAFRGFILRVLEYRYGSFVALTVSSIIFGLLHISNAFAAHLPIGQTVIGAVYICAEAGILLGAAYIATRRIWLGIGIHWAWNFFEGPIYGTDVSGTKDPTLIHSHLTGPFFLTGGSFGPEASIVPLIVCTVAGLMLVRVAIRSGNWKPAGQWQPQSLPKSQIMNPEPTTAIS